MIYALLQWPGTKPSISLQDACICIPLICLSRENSPGELMREVQLSDIQAGQKRAKIQHSLPLVPQSLSEWVFQDVPGADSSIEQVRPHNRETLDGKVERVTARESLVRHKGELLGASWRPYEAFAPRQSLVLDGVIIYLQQRKRTTRPLEIPPVPLILETQQVSLLFWLYSELQASHLGWVLISESQQ